VNDSPDDEANRLARILALPDGTPLLPRALGDALASAGLLPDDPRLAVFHEAIASCPDDRPLETATLLETLRSTSTSTTAATLGLVERARSGRLIVPDFAGFSVDLRDIFDKTRPLEEGEVATYIPQLARVSPKHWGAAVCTVDGQRWGAGDTDIDFTAQSCMKPVNYCIALEEHGEEVVHQIVGREPSGRGFNELTLNKENRPHNPMINAGAIATCSLIRKGAPVADRFDHVMEQWRRLAGGRKAGFSNAVYLSEKEKGDRNYALGYFMKEKRVFPEGSDLLAILEFYFQCCSIEATCERMALVAATLAGGGICPLTGERILRPSTVRACLSLMSSCGMYDFSGEFAFSIGVPAKSGVSGALMVVVPNLLGLCTWSPRLDSLGNSVRGIAFCKELVSRFNFHIYDDMVGSLESKRDPRRPLEPSLLDRRS
jgi:glutaminase